MELDSVFFVLCVVCVYCVGCCLSGVRNVVCDLWGVDLSVWLVEMFEGWEIGFSKGYR